MPRTQKPKPEPTQEPQPQAAVVKSPPGEVLTLAEAAAYLGLPETEIVGLFQTKGLPGRLAAGEWRFLRAAIDRWLSTAATPAGANATPGEVLTLSEAAAYLH